MFCVEISCSQTYLSRRNITGNTWNQAETGGDVALFSLNSDSTQTQFPFWRSVKDQTARRGDSASVLTSAHIRQGIRIGLINLEVLRGGGLQLHSPQAKDPDNSLLNELHDEHFTGALINV